MSEHGWVFFWLLVTLAIAGGTGFAIANGEAWQPFVRGLLFAFAVQQLGLHIRKFPGEPE
jgi:hypothetical protein